MEPLDTSVSISTTVAGGSQPSTVPLPSSDYWSSLIRYPSSSKDGQAAHVSARIPIEWMESISVLRDWVKGQFPARNLWETTSDFVRFGIALGILEATKLRDAAESGNMPENSSTGLLAAQLFIEQTGGELQARSRTMTQAQNSARDLARTIRDLLNRKEPSEAADMVSRWIEGARKIREQSGAAFWETYFITSLFRIPTAIEDTEILIKGGYIIDEDTIASVEHVLELIEAGDLELYSDDSDDSDEKVLQFPDLMFPSISVGDHGDSDSTEDTAQSS